MHTRWKRLGTTAAAVALTGALCSLVTPAHAYPDMYDGQWRFTFVPYLWFPTVNGTLNFTTGGGPGGPPPNTTVGLTIGPNSYLTNLNFAFLGYFEARKSNWSVFADFVTMSLSGESSSIATFNVGQGLVQLDPSVNANTTSSFSTTLATLAGSYTVVHHDMTTLDVFAGAQLASATTSVNWTLTGPRGMFPQTGSASAGTSVVAGVVGIKGNIQLGASRWFIPYYLDAGGGGYTTYEAMAGIAYAFSWGDVALTYRHLYIDMGSGGVLQNVTLSGPMLGVAFHW